MTLVSTAAILLRSHPYGESSTILRFYTRELGVVGVLARGARSSQSRGRSAMGTFSEGLLTLFWKGSRELQTMKEFVTTDARQRLAGHMTRFAAASVLSELVLRNAGSEGNPDLYARLAQALDRVGDVQIADPVAVFLAEAWGIVDQLGYRPELESCVVCGRPLEAEDLGRFDFSAGGLRCPDCAAPSGGPRVGPGARAQLAALAAGEVPAALTRPRAHAKLLRDFVTYHVSDGRPLQSFGFFLDQLRPPDA